MNYLNGELLKNNNDLDYINDKISIFRTKDILNFDKIEKEDFEKILLMVDPSIKEIFSDKTCNYQGIMYIIKGIRPSNGNKSVFSYHNCICFSYYNLFRIYW